MDFYNLIIVAGGQVVIKLEVGVGSGQAVIGASAVKGIKADCY